MCEYESKPVDVNHWYSIAFCSTIIFWLLILIAIVWLFR
jgi:hypothetical protein